MKELLKLTYIFLVAGTLLACEARTVATTDGVDGEQGDTAIVSRRNPRVSEDLAEFRAWVNDKANRVDSSADKNWPKVKEEYKVRTTRLESRMDSLSAQSKQEYAELKTKYQNWESKKERRESQPLQPDKIQEWQQQLLGANTNLASLTAPDMRETYLLFMGIVRAKKQRWTQEDWDYVDHVYSQLNNRREQVESGISTADRIKIKSLQAEYLALEASGDVKDLYNHVK
ncbi:MAG: hypothetical protein COW65_14425 [Cytophagales bacterium CG18_big_fil_WC_8_21_14_2_50_42_9]|nr:MAG: hypothetical protein COW65_14425 [Cytophagales bacterium CG18_big_fil_WC_8_21_14_2_50_42_9]